MHRSSHSFIYTSVKIIKNEVGCRDDTVPKTEKALRGGLRACNNLPQPPKTKDVGRGLRKIVACSQSSSQCLLVNPRRACEARVTVVVVWVCHSCLRTHFSSHRSRQKQAHIPSSGRRSENMWDFL